MANFTAADPFNIGEFLDNASIAEFFDEAEVIVETGTEFVLRLIDGVDTTILTLTGTFGAYVDHVPTTGTVTGMSVLSTDGSSFTITHASISVADFTGFVAADDLTGLFVAMFHGNDTFNGSDGADTIAGFEGDDVLNGGAGADVLIGGLGRDTMAGGLDNDAYLVDHVRDKVVELAGQGGDVVISFVNYVLPDNVEVLTLAGTATMPGTAIRGVGNALNNNVIGNAQNNVLNGLAGNDMMQGQAGDDLYYVDSAGDQVVEGLDAGWDAVRASVDYTLAANVEELFVGGAARDGTGNALANTLHGSGAANTLSGLAGDDIVRGGNGRDILLGGDGADLLDGGIGKDTLTGGAGRDVFQFRDGDFGATRVLADVIADFSHADAEKIQLNLVDADSVAAGNQAFAWLGTGAFTGVAGQLHYAQAGGSTYVEGDTNGDGTADIVIALTGTISLVASDFVL